MKRKKVMFQNCLVINHFNHRVTGIYLLAYSSDTCQCSKLNHIAQMICFPFQFLSLLLAFLAVVDLIQEASADRSVQITAVFVALAIKVGSYVSFWGFFHTVHQIWILYKCLFLKHKILQDLSISFFPFNWWALKFIYSVEYSNHARLRNCACTWIPQRYNLYQQLYPPNNFNKWWRI